ncbi:MAG: dTMP kinase [Candidatus Korobacteraceae bacterium]
MAQSGKFITFEGLDGCGKTTQLERLAAVLRAEGIEVITTREPGGTPIGEKIRAVLLDSRTQGLAALAELSLMFASRAQQIAEIIEPALQRGQWVLCDRFTDSSEAYQGGGRELGSEAVLTMHRVVCGDLQPNLTVLMDSDVDASVSRARRRNLAAKNHETQAPDENRFERENRMFFARVHDSYLRIAHREPARVYLVDARRGLDVVHADIVAAVRERLRIGAKVENSSGHLQS